MSNSTGQSMQARSGERRIQETTVDTSKANFESADVDVSLYDVFNEIKALADKLKVNKKINTPVGVINNMILQMRQSGIYRNNDIILVAQPYALVISTTNDEHVINVNQSLLSAIVNLAVTNPNDELMSELSQSIEMLYLEHEEYVTKASEFHQNAN
jgi:hypothetical protein